MGFISSDDKEGKTIVYTLTERGKMSSDNSVRIHDDSDHDAESIKNASRDIRESSSTTEQLVHTLVRTGAFEEIARAILETLATDTSIVKNP